MTFPPYSIPYPNQKVPLIQQSYPISPTSLHHPPPSPHRLHKKPQDFTSNCASYTTSPNPYPPPFFLPPREKTTTTTHSSQPLSPIKVTVFPLLDPGVSSNSPITHPTHTCRLVRKTLWMYSITSLLCTRSPAHPVTHLTRYLIPPALCKPHNLYRQTPFSPLSNPLIPAATLSKPTKDKMV